MVERYLREYTVLEGTSRKEMTEEIINHPAHYKAEGIEVIDIIESFGLGFHLGNAVKYILRAGRNPLCL